MSHPPVALVRPGDHLAHRPNLRGHFFVVGQTNTSGFTSYLHVQKTTGLVGISNSGEKGGHATLRFDQAELIR